MFQYLILIHSVAYVPPNTAQAHFKQQSAVTTWASCSKHKIPVILRSRVAQASQGLLQLQAWVYLGFYKRAADFYE